MKIAIPIKTNKENEDTVEALKQADLMATANYFIENSIELNALTTVIIINIIFAKEVIVTRKPLGIFKKIFTFFKKKNK